MHEALIDALSRVGKVGQELELRWKRCLEDDGVWREGRGDEWVKLWEPEVREWGLVDFEVIFFSFSEGGSGFKRVCAQTRPTPELLMSLSLSVPDMNETLESQIENIRQHLLPSYHLSSPRNTAR
jgi:hypothetical protein